MMASQEPMKIDYPVYNGFIHYHDAASLRTPSLEEYLKEREAKSCPVSSILPDLDSARSTIASLGDMGVSASGASCPSTPPPGLAQGSDEDSRINYHDMVKNTFIDYQGLRHPSLEGFLRDRETQSCPGSAVMDKQSEACRSPGLSPASTSASSAVEEMSYLAPPPGLPPFPPMEGQAPMFPPIEGQMSEMFPRAEGQIFGGPFVEDQMDQMGQVYADEGQMQSMQSPFVISLSDGLQLGQWSAGSVGHDVGCCKPCAFMWKNGCKSGADCPFCHLCAPGEIRRRKKEKVQFRKVSRVIRSHTLRYGSGLF